MEYRRGDTSRRRVYVTIDQLSSALDIHFRRSVDKKRPVVGPNLN